MGHVTHAGQSRWLSLSPDPRIKSLQSVDPTRISTRTGALRMVAQVDNGGRRVECIVDEPRPTQTCGKRQSVHHAPLYIHEYTQYAVRETGHL